jgi:uncharacterized protein YndB with AHSA1/START domain
MTPTTFDPGPLAEVQYRPEGDRWTLVFVRTLRHPPERVWEALTEPDRLREWAPYDADRNLDGLGQATLTMVDGDTREELDAEVTRADRPTLLEYSWGGDNLRWELSSEGSGTRLTLRHTVADRDLGPKVAAGWHLCIEVAARRLDGEPVGPIRGQDAMSYGWQELHDTYAERLQLS